MNPRSRRSTPALQGPPGVGSVLAFALAALASQEPPPTPVFGTQVETVRLDVIVLDRDGRPVTGLTAADFDVEEGGVKQAVNSFEEIRVARAPHPADVSAPPASESRERSPEEGRCIFVLFDDAHLSPPGAERARQGLRRFLDYDVREGDWVTLLANDQQVWWTARNGWEYRQLRAVVDHLKAGPVRDPFRDGISDFEAVCMDEYHDQALCRVGPPGGAAPAAIRRETFQPHGATGSIIGGGDTKDLVFDELSATAKRRISVTIDGLRQALDSLAALRGHKSVVLVSEGFILLPKMSGYADVIAAARRANVAVHLLDPRGLESGYGGEFQDAPPTFAGTRRELDLAGAGDLSDATGGHTIYHNDLAGGLRQLAEESEAYYLVGYTPEAGRPGERKIRVRVARAGVVVRARSRYYVDSEKAQAKEADRRRSVEAKTGFGAAAVRAMRSVADEAGLPLRVGTLFFDANGKGEVRTLVAAEMPPKDGPARLKVVAEARRAEGGPPVRQQFEEAAEARAGEPLVIAREWRLPPGVWQLRVLVEESRTARVGSAVHTFEVPRAVGLRLSTPLLTTQVDGESGTPRPHLTLGRRFAPSGRLYCQFSVFGSGPGGVAPRVRAGWELRRGPDLVRRADATSITPAADGRVMRLFGVSLGGAPAGRYSLRIRVSDEASGETVERSEEFEIS